MGEGTFALISAILLYNLTFETRATDKVRDMVGTDILREDTRSPAMTSWFA